MGHVPELGQQVFPRGRRVGEGLAPFQALPQVPAGQLRGGLEPGIHGRAQSPGSRRSPLVTRSGGPASPRNGSAVGGTGPRRSYPSRPPAGRWSATPLPRGSRRLSPAVSPWAVRRPASHVSPLKPLAENPMNCSVKVSMRAPRRASGFLRVLCKFSPGRKFPVKNLQNPLTLFGRSV